MEPLSQPGDTPNAAVHLIYLLGGSDNAARETFPGSCTLHAVGDNFEATALLIQDVSWDPEDSYLSKEGNFQLNLSQSIPTINRHMMVLIPCKRAHNFTTSSSLSPSPRLPRKVRIDQLLFLLFHLNPYSLQSVYYLRIRRKTNCIG